MGRRMLRVLNAVLIVSLVLISASMMTFPKAEEIGKITVDTIIVRPVIEEKTEYHDLLYGDFICKYHFQPYPGIPEGISLHILESDQIIVKSYDVCGPSPPGTQFADSLWFSFVGDFQSLENVHAVVTITVSFCEFVGSGSSSRRISYGSDRYCDTLSVPVIKRGI